MDRDIYVQLLAWRKSHQRKPLVIRGARQVGKTHSIKRLAKNEYQNACYVNFESDRQVHEFFQNDLNPHAILEKLRLFYDLSIEPETTLLIFDEIQECSEALNSLKYFCEQAREYHVAAAGSLLGVKLANTKGFPVGKVDFIDLYPMSFEEFLTALGKQRLRDFLESLQCSTSIPEAVHNQLLTLLRQYYFLGGMPEVIKTFTATEDYAQARQVQQAIIDAYLLDFSKHAPANDIVKINQVWSSIPAQLARENKKFVFSIIKKSARGREYEAAIQWLVQAGLSLQCFNVSTPSLPLKAYTNWDAYKLYLSDVGLLGAMAEIEPNMLVSKEQLFKEFKGALTENYVAQQFLATSQSNSLYYWTSAGTAEVDFLISQNAAIYPIEVKAGEAVKSKSLKVFADKYPTKKLIRFSAKNLSDEGHLLNIPLYAIGQLSQLIAT